MFFFLLVSLLIKIITQWAHNTSWDNRFYDTPSMYCYEIILHNQKYHLNKNIMGNSRSLRLCQFPSYCYIYR